MLLSASTHSPWKCTRSFFSRTRLARSSVFSPFRSAAVHANRYSSPRLSRTTRLGTCLSEPISSSTTRPSWMKCRRFLVSLTHLAGDASLGGTMEANSNNCRTGSTHRRSSAIASQTLVSPSMRTLSSRGKICLLLVVDTPVEVTRCRALVISRDRSAAAVPSSSTMRPATFPSETLMDALAEWHIRLARREAPAGVSRLHADVSAGTTVRC
mmetsp:Transcript_14496/g.41767  ORF Transcript_14496/g.41767 Transcript_14496/m.41767 type:complete len:212 (-) Transcript_14496:263-898(-)